MQWFRLLIGLALAPVLASPASSEPTAQAVTPTAAPSAVCNELSTCLTAFRQDLERLRLIMGEAPPPPLDIGIRNVTPYDLYFQSLALLQRTNRLAFEFRRTVERPLPQPPATIQASDALAPVQEAYRVLKEVLADPQVEANYILVSRFPGEPPPIPATASSSDSFALLVTLNRQLNLLLERHFSPSDTYVQVTLAVAYTAQLLARYPDAVRLPEEPPYEAGKQPADVYLQLYACLQSLVQILRSLDLPAPVLEPQPLDKAHITAGDVFLLASVVVSQLDFLHQQLGVSKPPRQVFYAGRKCPADVYQRAGLLQAQLAQLTRLVAAHGAPKAGK